MDKQFSQLTNFLSFVHVAWALIARGFGKQIADKVPLDETLSTMWHVFGFVFIIFLFNITLKCYIFYIHPTVSNHNLHLCNYSQLPRRMILAGKLYRLKLVFLFLPPNTCPNVRLNWGLTASPFHFYSYPMPQVARIVCKRSERFLVVSGWSLSPLPIYCLQIST
jgi:hypothetical protein